MRTAALVLAFFSFLSLVPSSNAEEAKLRFLVSGSNPPFIEVANHDGRERVVQGILKDLGEELGKEMKMSTEFLSIPRMRIAPEMASGKATIACNYRPDWLPGEYVWVPDLFPNPPLVAWRKEAKPLQKLDDLKGKKILTVKGFAYPSFDSKLGASFVRDDSDTIGLAIQRLVMGDADYMVINAVSFNFYRKNPITYGNHFAAKSLMVNDYKTGCAIAKNSPISAEQTKAALEKLIKRGVIKRLLKGYGI